MSQNIFQIPVKMQTSQRNNTETDNDGTQNMKSAAEAAAQD